VSKPVAPRAEDWKQKENQEPIVTATATAAASNNIPASLPLSAGATATLRAAAEQILPNTSLFWTDSFSGGSNEAPRAPAGPSAPSLVASPSDISLSFTPPPVDDAIALRQFALELVKASGTEGSLKQTAAAIRAALANHPEVLVWILRGEDLDKIVTDAELPALPESDHPVIEALPSISSALKTAFGAVKKLRALTLDVQDAEKVYDAYDREGLVAAVGQLSQNYATTSLLEMGRTALIALVVRLAREQALTSLNSMSAEKREQILSAVFDVVYEEIARQIDSAVMTTKVSDSPEIKMLLDPSQGFDLTTVSPAFREFFENVLTQYFDKLPLVDKRRIAIGLLELSPGRPDEEKLAAILNNSGPAMQKLFQLFGDDVKSEKVGKVMVALKSKIKPFPGAEAVSIVERELGGPVSELFESFRETPVAAASIGQVHLASLKGTGEDVIVKIMRPGIVERVQRELALLKELAPSGGTRKIVDRLEESLMEELDFTLEAKNMKDGEVYANSKKGVQPIGLVSEFEATRDVLVMKRAYINPINEFHGQDLPGKSAALATFTEMWYKNALFKDGFFHGDLHAGNIFFNPNIVHEDGSNAPDHQLTLIDFGACGRLSLLEQRSIISLMLGVETRNAEIVASALGGLCTLTPEQESVLQECAGGLLGGDLSAAVVCAQVINKAIELDVNLPKNFVLYNRGRAFLENQIRDTNAELESWDTSGEVAQVNPEKLFRKMMAWNIGKDLLKRVFGGQPSTDGKLDPTTVSRMIRKDGIFSSFMRRQVGVFTTIAVTKGLIKPGENAAKRMTQEASRLLNSSRRG